MSSVTLRNEDVIALLHDQVFADIAVFVDVVHVNRLNRSLPIADVVSHDDTIEIGIGVGAIAGACDRHDESITLMHHDIARLIDGTENLHVERDRRRNVHRHLIRKRRIPREIAFLE